MIQDIIDYVTNVFQSQDQLGWIAMVAIVVIAGLMLGAFGSLLRFTIIALVVFGVVILGRKILLDGAEPVSQVQASGQQLADLSLGTFLVYFVAFAVVIGAVHMLKSAVTRGAH